jgi:hypothetical protein
MIERGEMAAQVAGVLRKGTTLGFRANWNGLGRHDTDAFHGGLL